MKRSLAVLLVLVTACSSTPDRLAPIDNALLAEVSEDGRAVVQEARAAHDVAVDAHAYRLRLLKACEQEVRLARATLQTVRSKLEESKLRLSLAEESSASELGEARARYEVDLAAADLARESLTLAKREHVLAQLEERLAVEDVRLQEATVELAKARVLQGVDLIEAQAIPLKDHEAQVEYHRGEVEVAREKVRAQKTKVEDARRARDAVEARRDMLEARRTAA